MTGSLIPLLFGAGALLVAVFRQGPVAGFAPTDVAASLAFAGAALLVKERAAERSRGSWGATATAVTLWLVSLGFLGLLYNHRGLLVDGARTFRDIASLSQPEAEVGQGGEVTITRRSGTFLIPAKVNDKPARFVFDTGASTVVLTHDTAQRLGLGPDKLSFRLPVGTANGTALAAPVTLDSLSVGSITLRRVPALVVGSGLLAENLLGQTFLERLASYEVRGNRLVFRAVRS